MHQYFQHPQSAVMPSLYAEVTYRDSLIGCCAYSVGVLCGHPP
jgi:hypothetical protein